MSLFSTVGNATRLLFDSSSAAMEAKEVYDGGGTIREVVTTFARETDNAVDDKIVEEMCQWAEFLAEMMKSGAGYALRLADSADDMAPAMVDKIRAAANVVEIRGPDFVELARLFAKKSTELADILEREGGPSANSNNNAGA